MLIQRVAFSLNDSFEVLGCSAEEVENTNFFAVSSAAGERIEKY